jgi:N-methylhydantoinase B/oxoprolinase/acetone carboxylase alpha subunit
MCSCRNEALEFWERRYPVRFTSFQLRQDSGGAGRHRGGLGYRKELELLADVRLNAFQDRHLRGARGLQGGQPGAPNALLFEIDGVWDNAVAHFGSASPSKLANIRLPRGTRIAICAGGGGGMGEPAERPAAAVSRDVALGYVSRDAAARVYGRREVSA